MIRYYLYTNYNSHLEQFEVYYIDIDGTQKFKICKTEQDSKNFYDELYSEKIGYPIV